jgi:electron transfer flavoprotein alpha subunit
VKEQDVKAVLFSGSKRNRLLSALVAASLGTCVVPDVSRTWVEEGEVWAEHMVYGGTALRVERNLSKPAVLLISEGLLASLVAGELRTSPAVTIELSLPAEKPGIRLVERRPKPLESIDLAAASRVVSVGRGLAKQDDLALVEGFAHKIGAEMGCTRPLAESEGWMDKARYIGVSGAMLKPEVFVAVGVSGQVQHMVGVSGARSIFAINKDKNASIFKQTDYGIVGDLYDVLPKLAEELGA